MPKVQSAPIQDPVIEYDFSQITTLQALLSALNSPGYGKAKLSWTLFFQNLLTGDIGNKWTPVATNLTSTVTPIITGNYYQNQGFTDFWIKVTPGSGGTTSATAGTTYFSLPFLVSVDTGCDTALSTTQIGRGVVQASTARVYPFSWSVAGSPIVITGRVLSQ